MILAFERAGLHASLLTAESSNVDTHPQVAMLHDARVLQANVPSPIGRYPSGFIRLLRRMASEVDLVHIHGLWRYPTLVGGPVLRHAKVPYVVSPHGLLMPEALSRHALRKSVALRFGESRTLLGARLLLADGVREAEALGVVAPRLRCAVVPLAVDTTVFSPGTNARDASRGHRKQLLTVSRLHPIKRLVELVEAFARVASRNQDWDLLIAGPEDDAGYRERIQSMSAASGLSQRVQLLGRLEGHLLVDRYRSADIFVLPSTSESSGLSVVEALSVGTPVIATTGTPWAEIETDGCGWWIEPGVDAMAIALDRAMNASPETRQAMRINARGLALRNYSFDALRTRLLETYGQATTTP